MMSYISNNIDKIEIETKLLGKYNALNVLSTYVVLLNLGFEKNKIIKKLSAFDGPQGRFERYYFPGNRIVIIDYAHTPASLQNIIELARAIYKGKKIIVLFGCGGNKAKEKRPLMGKCSTEKADFVYLTSDNPRAENPVNIVEDIKKGITTNNFEIILDRRKAILRAINNHKNSIIILAGKGSEKRTIGSTFEIKIECSNCGRFITHKLNSPIPKIIEESDLDLIINASKKLNLPIVKNSLIGSAINSLINLTEKITQ